MKVERRKKIRLGELLIEQKVINEDQLTKALAEQKRTGRKLGRVLTDLGIVEEQQLNDALARHLQIPFVDLRQLSLDQNVVRLLPEALARRFRALVLQQDKNGLTVGMADPTDLFVYDELVARLKQPLRIALVRETELLRTMDIVYRRTEQIASIALEVREELRTDEVDLMQLAVDESSSDAPIIRDYQWLEGRLGPLVPVEVVVRLPPECSLTFAERMKLVEQVEQQLRQDQSVGGTISAATFVPPQTEVARQAERTAAHANGYGLRQAIANRRLADSRGELEAAGYLVSAGDEELWRISTRVSALGDVDYEALLARCIEDARQAFEHGLGLRQGGRIVPGGALLCNRRPPMTPSGL